MKVRELITRLERIATEEGDIEVLLHVINNETSLTEPNVECIGDVRSLAAESGHNEDETSMRFIRILGDDAE